MGRAAQHSRPPGWADSFELRRDVRSAAQLN